MGSITSWIGELYKGDNGEWVIDTTWQLIRSKQKNERWEGVITNKDLFSKQN